jgi:hypothetical protein
MRKILLSVVLLGSCTYSFGQGKKKMPFLKDLAKPDLQLVDKNQLVEPLTNTATGVNSTKGAIQRSTSNSISSYTLERIPIGESVNPFTVLAGQRTNLYADPNLNAVSFIRRGGGTDNGGVVGNPGQKLFYDVSKNGGADWIVGQGPIYNDDSRQSLISLPQPNYGARYPQGLIWNPAGNTNPDNARQVAFASVLTGKNGGAWGGMSYGSHLIANTEPAKDYLYDDNSPQIRYISEGLTVTPNGDIWHAEAEAIVQGTGLERSGKIMLTKAAVNPANGEMSLTVKELFLPNASGGTIRIADVLVAFSPNGQIGFVTVLGNIPDPTYCPDEIYYPMFFKSTDAGETWAGPFVIDLNDSPGLVGLRTAINGDSALDIDETTGDTVAVKMIYSTTFEHDIAVDKNGNLHFLLGLAYAGARNSSSPPEFSIFFSDFHIVDIHGVDPDDMNKWSYFYMGKPNSFRGLFIGSNNTQITEDNRLQTSRNADGSRIYFAWFDTDTAYYASALTGVAANRRNILPDLMLAGVDVSDPASLKTMKTRNVTMGSDAEGALIFANVSPNLLTSSCGAVLPVSYVQLSDPADGPVTHIYLSGVCTPNADTVFVNDPATYDTELIGTTTPAPVRNNVMIESLKHFSIYPNPAKSMITLSGINAAKGTSHVVIRDVMGRNVGEYTFAFGAPNTSIDINSLKNGIYVLTVSKNGETKSVKFIKN